MHIIGIVGGIASGKSAVSAELESLGAVVLKADQAAHEVINLPEVKESLVTRWGSSILTDSEEIDRRAVAERVFSPEPGSDQELHFLEQTLHPQIRKRFEAELQRLAQRGVPAAVLDAPLLLEAGWESLCDAVVFVDSAREKRLERQLLQSAKLVSIGEVATSIAHEVRNRHGVIATKIDVCFLLHDLDA